MDRQLLSKILAQMRKNLVYNTLTNIRSYFMKISGFFLKYICISNQL